MKSENTQCVLILDKHSQNPMFVIFPHQMYEFLQQVHEFMQMNPLILSPLFICSLDSYKS